MRAAARRIWQRIRRPYYYLMLLEGWLFIPIGVYLYVLAYVHIADHELLKALWVGACGVGYWWAASIFLPVAADGLKKEVSDGTSQGG